MKEKIKTNKAITLIALIITVIILLILAVVSIKLVWDGGIITYAKIARDKYDEAQKNELEQLNEIFGENKNENGNVPEDLEKYFLGEDKKGEIELTTLFTDKGALKQNTFKGVTFTNKNITLLFQNSEKDIYVRYNDAAYKIEINVAGSEMLTKSIKLVYTPDSSKKEGTLYKYSYDGTKEHEEDWIILYNNGDNYEIISPNAMGSLTLGENDNEWGPDEFYETCDYQLAYSYNNAINRLNKYCEDQITNTNKLRVRCVGSNPVNPLSENDEKLTEEFVDSDTTPEPYKLNGKLKLGDSNYEEDIVRMYYWGIQNSNTDYWIASRSVEIGRNTSSGAATLSLRKYNSKDSYNKIQLNLTRFFYSLAKATYGTSPQSDFTNGVRPIVKINVTH